MAYTVQLEKFSGPLDVLLKLIEDQKLVITEISLAKVADQFLDHLKNNKNILPDNLASFLVVAAKLILIKSKALLPMLELTEEEEDDIKDFEQNLLEYKRFKEIAEELGKQFAENRVFFSRKFYENTGIESEKQQCYIPKNFKLDDLADAFQKIIDDIPKIDALPRKKVLDVITLEEKILQLKKTLGARVMLSFRSLAGDTKTPVEVIVTFLAILEMMKQKFIVADQQEIFGEIMISKNEVVKV